MKIPSIMKIPINCTNEEAQEVLEKIQEQFPPEEMKVFFRYLCDTAMQLRKDEQKSLPANASREQTLEYIEEVIKIVFLHLIEVEQALEDPTYH